MGRSGHAAERKVCAQCDGAQWGGVGRASPTARRTQDDSERVSAIVIISCDAFMRDSLLEGVMSEPWRCGCRWRKPPARRTVAQVLGFLQCSECGRSLEICTQCFVVEARDGCGHCKRNDPEIMYASRRLKEQVHKLYVVRALALACVLLLVFMIRRPDYSGFHPVFLGAMLAVAVLCAFRICRKHQLW